MMDGTTFFVPIPDPCWTIEQVKDAIRALRSNQGHDDITAGTTNAMELFKGGSENALPDAKRLNQLGIGDKAVLFLLPRQGSWSWTKAGRLIHLGKDNLVRESLAPRSTAW